MEQSKRDQLQRENEFDGIITEEYDKGSLVMLNDDVEAL